jgi:polyisoprenoid-binding protein YceI
MKLTFSSIVLAASLSLVACQSEITDKPAAEVSDTAVTTATDTASTAPAGPTSTANVIKEKSSIGFVGAKVVGDHTGQFQNFDGTLEYAGNRPQKVSFTIDLNSVKTDQEKLDGHLKSPDFFDVAKYPTATFTSTSLAEAPAGAADGATHMLEGTLDLHGVTKNVTIPVKTEQTADGVRTTSEFTINRHDWGVSYKGAPDNLIKDNVLIKLDLSFPPPPAV